MNDGLRNRIVEIAQGVAPGQVRKLAGVIQRATGPSTALMSAALDAVPVPQARRVVSQLFDDWRNDSTVPAAEIASSLLASVATAESIRANGSLEIVWTGPASHHVPVRMTQEVVLELLAEAQKSVLLVSYAAFRVPTIIDALASALDRGVDVRFVLESSEASGGRLTVDAARAFGTLADRVRCYEWSISDRQQFAPDGAAMHAKGLLLDDRIALVTSANFTGSAMERNMELGLLVRGGEVPVRLASHFRSLISSGVLREVSPVS